MTFEKFGEIKEPFIVWLFFTIYLAMVPFFSIVTTLNIPNLLVQTAEVYGVLLAFLIVFLVLVEKHRSLREVFSSVGLKRNGTAKSVLWSFALFPLLIAIGGIMMMLTYFLAPVSTSGSGSQQVPSWYIWYMLIQSFFPVAVVEEMWARGFMLDRFMPQHPSSLSKATPAIVLSSILFTVWHLPTYLRSFRFQLPWVSLQAGNVFLISVVLGLAYARARTRNIVGLVLVHFLLDALPIIVAL